MSFERHRCPFCLGFAALVLLCVNPGPAAGAGEFDRAARLAMVEDYEGALKEYERFLYDHPEHELAPLAALAAGNLWMEAFEDPQTAARAFDIVTADYGSSALAPEAAFRRGTALQALEDWRGAAESFERAMSLAGLPENTPSARWLNEVVSGAADCYHRLEDHPGVLRTYRRALDGSPPPEVTATALWRMGEAYEAVDDAENAAKNYAAVLERAPCASRQIFAQAMGKRDLIDRHVAFDWEPYLAYQGTDAYIGQRDFSGALDECRRAEAMDPNPAIRECLEARAISLESVVSADFAEGCRKMEAHREKYSGGQMSERTANLIAFWQSVVGAEEAVAEDPDNPAALSGLGVLYFYTGAYGPTIETMERAQRLDPDLNATYEVLGYAYYYTDRLEEALDQFDRLLEKGEPEESRFFAVGGAACLRLERFDKAVSYFERQVEKTPEDATAHSNLADALYRAGKPERTVEACRKSIDLDPNNPSAYYFLGQVHRDRSETAEAIQALERFLDLDPGSSLAEEVRATLEDLRAG